MWATMRIVTEFVPLVILVALVSFSVLRVVIPRRLRVQRQPDGAFELERPLGRRLLEGSRLLFWSVILLLGFLASLWNDFAVGILGCGTALVVLVWRAADRIWRSTVVIDRLRNEVLQGGRWEGRTDEVQAVVLQRHGRQPLALIFREPDGSDRRWGIPGADPETAESVGRRIADYLGVPLDETV